VSGDIQEFISSVDDQQRQSKFVQKVKPLEALQLDYVIGNKRGSNGVNMQSFAQSA